MNTPFKTIRRNFRISPGIFIALVISPLFFKCSCQQKKVFGEKTVRDYNEQLIFADSIRNSYPDSAESIYNKLISAFCKDHDIDSHYLSQAHVGLATIYSDKGDYKSALNNDSVAKAIAIENNDNEILANALISEGIIKYRTGYYDESLTCYENAMQLAVLRKDTLQQAKIFSNRAIIHYFQGQIDLAILDFKKSLSLSKKIKKEELVAGNYMHIATVYANIGKNDSVLEYNKLALNIFKKINDKKGQVICFRSIGNSYYDFSEYGSAIVNYNQSVKLALELNLKSEIAKGYHNLSEIYFHLGENNLATDLLFKSIKLKEDLGDKLSLGKGYIALGDMYYARDDYEKAQCYYRKSLKLFQELKSVAEIGHVYGNMASVFSSEHKRDSAIFFYEQAIELYKTVENKFGLSNLYINLGDELRLEKEFRKSEKLLLLALNLKKELGDNEGFALGKNHLANLYLEQSMLASGDLKNNKLRTAEKAALESYTIGTNLQTLPVIRDASSTLVKVYKKLTNYQEALKYSEIFNSCNDSILCKAKIQALVFAEARWNIEKKQKEIDVLENLRLVNEQVIKQKEIEAHQHRLIIVFLITLTLLFGISVLFIAIYIKNRRDTLYQKQVARITALRLQNTRNSISPHFFFNVLGSITGLTSQPERLKVKLKNLTFLLRKVIENIDQIAVPLETELDAVKAYIDLYSERIPHPFWVDFNIGEGINLDVLVPAMIIQIPVENAIKHGLMLLEGEKRLTISVNKLSGVQYITISDNGVGLKASAGRSTGTGTGLKVLMQTIHLLNAKNQEKIELGILEQSEIMPDSSGTTVKIKIPTSFNYTI